MPMIPPRIARRVALAAALAAAGAAAADAPAPSPAAYPSTYRVPAAPAVLIRGATVLTGTGARLDAADVLMRDGKVAAVGASLDAAGARVIEARGRWVTPGLIDVHSHLGVMPTPRVRGNSDFNESTAPATGQVWVEHSVWPQDPGFATALAGGITSLQVLPGSSNLVGGRSVVLKNVPSASVQGMKFPGAPHGLKMACGENPTRTYGTRNQFPATRMGNVAGYRAQWIDAQEYLRDQERYEAKLKQGGKAAEDAKPPKRDLRLETMAGALKGEILVHMHCYRADEMAVVLDMAREFGYRVTSFQHAIEAYKIATLLGERGACAAMWTDWWGGKMEMYDGIQENVAFVDAAAGGCAIVHSDDEDDIQRLNQEAGKSMARGRRAGLDIPPERAIRWVTANPAKSLGILKDTGTLEPGKMADLVLWNGDPFSVYAKADQVYIDGVLRFDRAAGGVRKSDFMLGQEAAQ